jgi:arginine/serine-rich splicing factor 16
MPWQGQADNLIDRFDVRAHLDYIPQVKKEDEEELTFEERQINYERYRIIAQNSFLAINEEKFLKQLHLEEQFGTPSPSQRRSSGQGGASIGFNYEDNTGKFECLEGNL